MLEIGILKNFDSGTYKAGVQLAGSLTTYFDDISVAKNIPSSAMVIGNYVTLAIPGGNPRDACIIASWPSGSPGANKLNDIGDVDVSGVADDDLFYYDQASGLWKPRKLVDADIPAAITRDTELADHAATAAAHHPVHIKTLADHPLSIIPTMDDDHIPAAIARDAEVAAAIATHAAKTTGTHGVGASTIESIAGSQAKVDAHNALALSHLVHNNNNYFLGYYDETIEDPPSTWVRPRSLVAIDDPSSGLDISDWYGASGAYRQADADSDATHIQDDDANFPASIRRAVVYWASNAAGDANTGIGVVTGLDSDSLYISKCSGADFAANYYYWIKHDEWVVPVTGIYSVKGTVTYYPDEADKWFTATIDAYTGVAAGAAVVGGVGTAAMAYYSQPTAIGIVSLTAGQHVYLNSAHGGTHGVPDIYRSNATHLPLQIWLLKQTA